MKHNHATRIIKDFGKCPACDEYHKRNEVDGNVHVVPSHSSMEHKENKNCWCEPTLQQDIDDEHDKQVWLHKGYEEVNQ